MRCLHKNLRRENVLPNCTRALIEYNINSRQMMAVNTQKGLHIPDAYTPFTLCCTMCRRALPAEQLGP